MPEQQKIHFVIADKDHKLNRAIFERQCRGKNIDPTQCVFIFPGNEGHHQNFYDTGARKFKDGSAIGLLNRNHLYEQKTGGGLAAVAGDLGNADIPTLSLPVTFNNITDKTQQKQLAEQAIGELWYAIGLGMDLMLPIRLHENSTYFSERFKIFEAGRDYEPSFWGGIETTSNKDLADYYMEQIEIIDLFLNNRASVIERFRGYYERGQEDRKKLESDTAYSPAVSSVPPPSLSSRLSRRSRSGSISPRSATDPIEVTARSATGPATRSDMSKPRELKTINFATILDRDFINENLPEKTRVRTTRNGFSLRMEEPGADSGAGVSAPTTNTTIIGEWNDENQEFTSTITPQDPKLNVSEAALTFVAKVIHKIQDQLGTELEIDITIPPALQPKITNASIKQALEAAGLDITKVTVNHHELESSTSALPSSGPK